MKPSRIVNLQQQTMAQAEETIRRRIDALGLTEPWSPLRSGRQRNYRGASGEGDPNRAKGVIQAGGNWNCTWSWMPSLFIRSRGPAAHGGVLPPNAVSFKARVPPRFRPVRPMESWYRVDRVPVVTGRDLRSATAVRSTKNSVSTMSISRFPPKPVAGFGPFTEQNIGKQLGIVLEHKLQTAPTINGRIDDTGVIEGQFGEQEANDLGLVLRSGALPPPSSIWKSAPLARRWVRIPSATACRPRLSACWSS